MQSKRIAYSINPKETINNKIILKNRDILELNYLFSGLQS